MGVKNGRGGGGGHVKFYPYEKEGWGAEKGGGHNKFWGSLMF